MGYYYLKYFDRIRSFKIEFFPHIIASTTDFKKLICLTKIVFCHQRGAVSHCLSGSSNDWVLFEGWERRGMTRMAGRDLARQCPSCCSQGRQVGQAPAWVQVTAASPGHQAVKAICAPRALTLVALNTSRISAQFELIYILMYLFFPSEEYLYFASSYDSLVLEKYLDFRTKKLLLTTWNSIWKRNNQILHFPP